MPETPDQVALHWFVPLADPVSVPEGSWRTPFDEGDGVRLVGVSVAARQLLRPFRYDEYENLLAAAAIALPGFQPGSGVSGSVEVPVTVMEIVGVFSPGTEPSEEEISDAFDLGMKLIHSLINAYVVVTKDPVRTPVRESLPPMVPMFTRRVVEGNQGYPGDPGVFVVSAGSLRSTFMTETTDADWSHIGEVFSENSYPFAAYVSTRTAASRFLERDGDYRGAILSAATACELLMNDVLLHVLWHEAVRPEDAAVLFSDPRVGILKRSQSGLSPRLKGDWSLPRNGALSGWDANVAKLRHRVIHAGFVPSRAEAKQAVESMFDLERFVLDRLCSTGVLNRYPQTALAMVGIPGLQRRGVYKKKFVDRAASWVGVAPLDTLFGRWRIAVDDQRLVSDGQTSPTTAGAEVLVVRHAQGSVQWFVFDATTGFAAPISDRTVDLAAPAATRLAELFADLVHRKVDVDVSVLMHELRGGQVSGDWQLAYRVLPNHEAMFDGSDRR